MPLRQPPHGQDGGGTGGEAVGPAFPRESVARRNIVAARRIISALTPFDHPKGVSIEPLGLPFPTLGLT